MISDMYSNHYEEGVQNDSVFPRKYVGPLLVLICQDAT